MKKNKTSQKDRKIRQERIKQAIAMVNEVVKIRLAPSKVHGIGVFAILPIKKGDRVYADAMPNMLDIPYDMFKHIHPNISQLILERFPRVVDGSQFLAPDTLMQLYMNHHNKPNYSNKNDKALRDIKIGEEVFENYKNIEGWKKVHPWLDTLKA